MNPGFAVYVGLVLARVGAFAAVMPPFAGRAPRMVRAGLAMALAAFYIAEINPDQQLPANGEPLVYAIALVREALIGAAMGFAFNLFLLPMRIAGEFVTQQVGLNVAQQLGPTGQDSAGAVTNLMETAGALIFLIADGHHVVLAALHGSFSVLPLGGNTLPTARPMVDGLGSAYEMGVLLAGPLVMCLFLLAITLAVMARAAPQLNVYSIGFTLQVMVVLVAGLFLMPDLVMSMHAIVGQTGQALPRILGG